MMTIQEPISAPRCGCDRADVAEGLWPVDDALEQLLSKATPLKHTDLVSLSAAKGRVLATDIRAANDSPRFDNSAVDGYAISTDYLTGQGPWTLTVQKRVAAGDPVVACHPDAGAVQIFTGAMLPSGFDAVVMQEDVTISASTVTIFGRPDRYLNVRKMGEEYNAGAIIVPHGTVMDAVEIACAAAAGLCEIRVTCKVKVALVVSGNEVRPAGDVLEKSEIWDVNTPMMRAVLDQPILDVANIVHVSDNRKTLSDVLRSRASTNDIVIVTGGASVGEEDHLHAAIGDVGGTILISGVAIKPGKPVTFGTVGDTLVVGLPGNPVSAFVTWMVLGRPILDQLAGKTDRLMPAHHVKAGLTLHHKPGRCEYRPARITGYDGSGIEVVETQQATHSGRITSLLGANGLVRIPSFVERVAAGDLLEFIPF